ncbi:MAG: T9SS type A sorting domain-containing protein [Flavobacteriales bacterium]|nr:T9SS type A sorting domain-containing protein [Flavobacteriales bacterium]
MRLLLLSFAAAFVTSSLSAQHPQWAFSFGSTQFERAYGIEVDPAGNVYICGAFDDAVDMDPDPVGEAILNDEGNGDVYLAKYSNAGEHLWSFRLGNYLHDLGSDIAVDADGNVYLTGYFRIDVDFDPGPGEAMLTSLSERDVFVAKYDTDGNYQWAFNIAFGGNVERYPGIGLDAEGNVLVTGEFFGSPDFDPGPGTGIITSNGNQDIFLAKYDGDGDFLWARGMGGPEFDRGMDVTADSEGNIHVTGMFRGTMTGSGTNLTANGGWDSFLAKFDPDGTHLWSFNMGGGGSEYPNEDECGMDLAVDLNDAVYVVGYYTGSPDFDPGPGEAFLALGADKNGYLAKYDPNGAHLWSIGLADSDEGQCNAVAVDVAGHVYITGTIDGAVDFDPGPGEAILVGWDHYVAKYTDSGDHVWSYDAGDTAYDGGWGIAVDDSANVYTTGVFFGTIDLDPDTGSYELVSEGGRDVFVAKHAPCASSTTTENVCAGSSYTLPNGNAVGAGLYPLSTSVGCDSVLLIMVEAIVLDTNVSQVGNTLIAAETDANYQWLDCNGDPIPAATAQSFEPEVTGSYAVMLERDGCSITSACQLIVITGIPELNATWNGGALLLSANVERIAVYDTQGRLVHSAAGARIAPFGLATGIYTIQLQGGTQQRSIRVLVQP